jgi:hypothetical protein
MPYQSQSNGSIAFKVQSAFGSIASGSGGTLLRTAGGPGGRITKVAYESDEVRNDGMRGRGRHGSRRTGGMYTCEVSIDMCDAIYEAVFRGTWESSLTITEATSGGPTEITTTTSTIVGNTGSWITVGLRVGDIIRLTDHATAGNNNRNLRITGLTATVITVAETLTLNAVADTAFTVTRPGQKLINPAAGSLVKRYFTIDEYDADLDMVETFQDCVFTSLRFQMQPNGMVKVDIAWTGSGVMTTASAGSAPTLTSPTGGTGLSLACVDAVVRMGSGDFVDLTSWDLMIDIGGVAPDVIAAVTAPDIFTGQMAVSMNLTMLRKDFVFLTGFLAETPYSLHAVMVENESEPKDFLSLFVPNFTLGSHDKSPLSKEAGARTNTIAVPQALVGKDETGGAFDPTMVKLAVSNAS